MSKDDYFVILILLLLFFLSCFAPELYIPTYQH